MTKKQWDPDAFCHGMIKSAVNANRYADEHADRLRKGRPTGSATIRDEYRGETQLYDHLSTSAETKSPSALSRELDSLEEDHPESNFSGDKVSFRKGYEAAIARVREQLKEYL